jgi:glycogen debranching enzyme
MDALVRGKAVTSRAGCPVELTALWASACLTLARLAKASGQAALADRADTACHRARTAFQARFWCVATSYPYDVISEDEALTGARLKLVEASRIGLAQCLRLMGMSAPERM